MGIVGILKCGTRTHLENGFNMSFLL